MMLAKQTVGQTEQVLRQVLPVVLKEVVEQGCTEQGCY